MGGIQVKGYWLKVKDMSMDENRIGVSHYPRESRVGFWVFLRAGEVS